ncbi:unnamed protein product [Pieris brassicae]|uniref:Uncharacterized protein n=1 Tax=Pieris brassicae TaxID=7116 RepID=A0A9P0SRY9_PIEBR|nr:unnamed protein product [Pieris brassicae]
MILGFSEVVAAVRAFCMRLVSFTAVSSISCALEGVGSEGAVWNTLQSIVRRGCVGVVLGVESESSATTGW